MRNCVVMPGDKRLIFVREQANRLKPWMVILIVLAGYALASNV